MPPLWDDRYTPADAEVIKKKAARIARNGFRQHDINELTQETAAHCFQRLPRHDPAKGSREKFLGRIAKNFLLNAIAKRRALRRDHSHDVEFDNTREGSLIDGRQSEQRIQRRIDLTSAIARMPHDLRQVWELRRDGHTERELESILARTRSQVRTLCQRLKRFLRDEKLDPFSDE